MADSPLGTSTEDVARSDFRLLRRAELFARGQRRGIACVAGLTFAVGIMNAVEPLVLRHVVDGLETDRASMRLLVGVIGLALVCVLRETSTALATWLGWRTRLELHHNLLEAAVDRLHGLSLAFHRQQPVGALMTRLDRSIQGIVGAFSDLVFSLLPSLVFLVFSAGMMIRLEWRLALAVLVLVPIPALIGAWAAPRQTARDQALLDRWSRVYARFNEVLGAMLTVKSFTMEREEQRRFLGEVAGANDIVVRGVGFDARISAAQSSIGGITRVAVVGFGGYLALEGRITVGTLLAFLAYLAGLFGPVQSLTAVYATVRRASVSLRTLFGILDSPAEIRDTPHARALDRVRGEIELDRVSFAYQTDGPAVLDGISLRIAPGETVALVGPSGGGKTTLAVLLQRLYEPCSGAIRIDGMDLRELTQESLRRRIGVVLQDAVLFNDSIRANIAYGRPNATSQDIERAARAAHAHEFIERLPEGYDTVVGERGALLSAGQRQRIAIARALLKDPPIVILDEATSALDATSEALVEEALGTLLRGRTTIVIAHRLSTVVRADRIFVLEGGRITETGTHAELCARGGLYAELVRLQTRGMLGDGPPRPTLPLAA